MTDSTAEERTHVNAEQVAEFLKNNPDFFAGRDELLMQMALPHKRGTAISLIERQLKLYRERDTELHHRFESLVNNARGNDRLFERIRQLVLALLESRDTEQAIESLKDSLDQEFNIEFHNLILFSSHPKRLPVQFESRDIAESVLGTTIAEGNAFCGRLNKQQTEFLFGSQADNIKSIAVAPLNFPDKIGLLVLGSSQEHHFRATLGTLFVSYLGDVLSRVLAQLMDIADDRQGTIKKNP
ncbi:DUF484 family protein [Endozoicomonas sp. Mp262]|uniref:DUF484 family protein n=1 Tax=Endozoicomonas sp. Mp262 TaxID=2919499 RepID=UPI0021D9722F